MNKQIAHSFVLSEVTVKAHRAGIMRKMKAHSLAQLVRRQARLVPYMDDEVSSVAAWGGADLGATIYGLRQVV